MFQEFHQTLQRMPDPKSSWKPVTNTQSNSEEVEDQENVYMPQ